MKLVLIFCLFLTGCGTTVLQNGQPVLKTYANAGKLKFRTPEGTILEVEGLDHATTTLATGQAISQVTGAIAGLAGTIGTAVVAHAALPKAPVAAVVVPAVTSATSRVSDSATATETRKQMQQGQYRTRSWDQ